MKKVTYGDLRKAEIRGMYAYMDSLRAYYTKIEGEENQFSSHYDMYWVNTLDGRISKQE